jgi:hypothetical protein
LLVRWRLPLLLAGLACLAIAYPTSRRLEFDRSIAAMFEPSAPTFTAYQELQQAFGGNSIVILVYRDRELATAAGLERNRAIAQQVGSVPGVAGVLSPALIDDVVRAFQGPGTGAGEPALFRTGDAVAEGFDELFAGYTHSSDHSRAGIVAMLKPDHAPQTIVQLAGIVDRLAAQSARLADGQPAITSAAIVGEPVLVHDGFALIERDGARLAVLTIALLSIVVVISLADLRFVGLTILVIGWSVVVTRAILVWLGIHLSLVSTILTAIVTVITVTTVLHLGVRFGVARSRGYSQRAATVRTLTLLLVPIVWTCATDAAGFAALDRSRILPIRQFGWMIAVAATAVLAAIVLLAPAAMMLPGARRGERFTRPQRRLARQLRRGCLQIAAFTVDHSRSCLGAAAVLTALAALGVGRAETETSFLNNFRPASRVVRAYADVETQFGGAGVWDVILDAPDTLDAAYLNQVRMLEDDLREIDLDGARLTKVLSLADAEAIAARSPLAALLPPAARLSAMYLVMPVFYDALLAKSQPGGRRLRIMLRSREQMDAEQKVGLIDEVERRVQRHVASEDWRQALGGSHSGSRVTGYYVLMARLVSQLVGDQWRCFFVSGVLVWLLLAIATRSLRLATVALVLNLLPVFGVLAAVAVLGGKINMGAAMIAAVSIGLSIDGSVHFLSGYRRYRARGHGPRRAAIHASGTVGVPVLLATFALVVGFGALSTSDFIPTATFGTLVAATLALGTAVNLTLLPTAVACCDR